RGLCPKSVTPPRLATSLRSRLADPPPPGEGGGGTLSASLRASREDVDDLLRWDHEHRHPPLEGEGRRRANARRRGGVMLLVQGPLRGREKARCHAGQRMARSCRTI